MKFQGPQSDPVTVWVVVYWYDHGECYVDSVWSTREAARKQVVSLGGDRYCTLYSADIDGLYIAQRVED